jgi:cell division GTPase FtsZ
MTNITDIREMKTRIIVFGIGGAGGNAVNNMIAAGLQASTSSSPTLGACYQAF